jgi:ParB-like chromosome segregation protein Spo0J
VPAATAWESRIVGWDEVPPDQLLANPANFRRHPARQREALRGSLDELGVIAPVIVNRTTGFVLDGHARVEEYLTAGLARVPVAYVELSPEQERLALLALDPISALAVNDGRALQALLDEVETQSEGLAELLLDLQRQAQSFQPDLEPGIGGRTVTDDDLARAAEGLDPRQGDRDQIRVLCPHCGQGFFVDR